MSAPTRIGINRESGGQRQRTLLQSFDAEELVAQRLFGRWGMARRQPPGPELHDENTTDAISAASAMTAMMTAENANRRRTTPSWASPRAFHSLHRRSKLASGDSVTIGNQTSSALGCSRSSSSIRCKARALSAAASRAIAASPARRTCGTRRSSAAMSSSSSRTALLGVIAVEAHDAHRSQSVTHSILRRTSCTASSCLRRGSSSS